MPKQCVSHHFGSATVIVRNKQTQGLETRHLEPHPLSLSLEQERKHTGLKMCCLKPCPSLLLLWELQTVWAFFLSPPTPTLPMPSKHRQNLKNIKTKNLTQGPNEASLTLFGPVFNIFAHPNPLHVFKIEYNLLIITQ